MSSSVSIARIAIATSIAAPIVASLFIAAWYRQESSFARVAAEAQLIPLRLENESLKGRLAEALRESIELRDELQAKLDEATGAIEDLERDNRKAVREIRELEQIVETDPELLMKYSKVFFLNEHYEPADLDYVNDEYLNKDRPAQFHDDAIRYLERMLKAAAEAGHDIRIASGYRSFDTQSQLKSGYTVQYGTGANAFSADQGYSEHQLGTAVDITTPAIGGLYTSFGTTKAFAWLQENAHRYGFTLSYPEGNAYYVYEPWHWRFVGKDLAKELYEEDMHFYDMEQRVIDKYLGELFD